MPYFSIHIPVKAAGEAPKREANETSSAFGSNYTTHNDTLSVVNKNGYNSVHAGHTPKLASELKTDCKSTFVFCNKEEALMKLKKHKDARMRQFDNKDDAVKYAQTGYEVLTTRYPMDKNAGAVVEANSPFRCPTRQEFVSFRKLIEKGDVAEIKKLIWDNPRYLVGYGDTPSTLKEGPRYNAMHICAIFKQAKAADFILKTVSDTKFFELLMGKKDDEMSTEFCRNLLDYYINITEKGRNDTPLHLAAKMGSVEMVELLTSYPQCKQLPNFYNLYPSDIICTRVNPDAAVEHKIRKLLGERFYIPVLRSTDNTIPPQIGQAFSQHNPPVSFVFTKKI